MQWRIKKEYPFWSEKEKQLKQKYPHIFKEVCENFYEQINKNPFIRPEDALKKSFPMRWGKNPFPQRIRDEFADIYVQNCNKVKQGCC